MPRPTAGEAKSHYMSRCVREVIGEGADQKAAVGKCEGMWREYHKSSMVKLFVDCFKGLCCDDCGKGCDGTCCDDCCGAVAKDATAQSTHAVTALGNERKRRQTARMFSELSENREMKDPAVPLDPDDGEDHIVQSFRMPFEVKKSVPDQQLIFGWASVAEKDGQLIVDKQGDIIPVEELENAAYDFVLYSRDHGDMHRNVGVGKMVESMVFTKEKQQALNIDLGMVGWWVGFKVNDSEVWDAHKRGERLEFSIGGAAIPVEVTEKKGGQRRFSRFPFDEGAMRAVEQAIVNLFNRQQSKLLETYAKSPQTSELEEADDYSVQRVFEGLLGAIQLTGNHAVERIVGNPGNLPSERRALGHLYDEVYHGSDQHARDQAEALLGRKVVKAARKSIQDTTREIASGLVAQGIKEKWSSGRLAEELQRTGLFDRGRAEMIARTEVNRAQNAAMMRVGYAYNKTHRNKAYKLWTVGPNPCPICLDNDGEEIPLDEEFPSGHQAPPVHPRCMCELELTL